MKLIANKVFKAVLVILISVFVSKSLHAQTPADDPGIGGPGTSDSAPAGDGAPIVPLDGGMSIMLIASGIGYSAKKLRKKEL